MKIIQMLATISFGDAVGNDARALYESIKKKGYETGIYAENIDVRLNGTEGIKRIDQIPQLKPEDIILYHLAIGTKLNFELKNYTGRKIIIYHNITPSEFFYGYNFDSYHLCKDGLLGAKYLGGYAEYVLADSQFNKRCLLELGYQCKMDVLPILIPMEDYQKKPNQKIIEKYGNSDCTNILFTGRIAPNKKQEDIILAFAYYQKYYNKNSRLFLVGSDAGMESYSNQLNQYVKKLGVKNVHFTGHIAFDEILAYYRVADAFLCQSEHEGFCVPLVEAMIFNVPIIAYDNSAIAETLGGSGILLKDKNPLETAAIMHRLLCDTKLREKVISNQKKRLEDFDNKKIEDLFWDYLDEFLGDYVHEQ